MGVIPFLPWLLGLVYLVSPTVYPIGSRLLLFGCLWLSAILFARLLVTAKAWKWLGPLSLILFLAPIYWLTLGRTVGAADTFEFQVVVPNLGIVHPTGYPLYLTLTKLFTLLPVNSVAWRVNLGTAIYGLAAVCLIFWLIWRLQSRPIPALLGALVFGVTPTFWSQAIEAEVYTLHALVVSGALLLMREIGGWHTGSGDQMPIGADGIVAPEEVKSEVIQGRKKHGRLRSFFAHPFGLTVLLLLVLGLGMTNHLTTLILLPPAILAVFFSYRDSRYEVSPLRGWKAPLLIVGAFLLPLFLYAYLPLRWAAVNGEPMGFSRFVDWVVGGRFQGALQLTAWLNDATRYEITGRLFEDEWRPAWILLIALLGAVWLTVRSWQYGSILFLTWLGYVFYSLNYYVPDLAVFLIPAFIVTAIWWGVGLTALVSIMLSAYSLISRTPPGDHKRRVKTALLAIALLGLSAVLLVSWNAHDRWSSTDASSNDGRTGWGRAVLSLPLENGSAILADSDKFPPLYYLQQVEGIRPDLDILVLPDEAAYRDELTRRVDADQSVYLARYLPGLEGIYHLGSLGPLTSVSNRSIQSLPDGLTPSSISFGPIRLLGYTFEMSSPLAGGEPELTLYWTSDEPVHDVLQVYLRWASKAATEVAAESVTGQHPANNFYPTVAWEPGEIVADFHRLTSPVVETPTEAGLQVALAPPFTASEELDWRTIAPISIEPSSPSEGFRPLHMQIGPVLLDGISIPGQVSRPTVTTILVSGAGMDHEGLTFELWPSGAGPTTVGQETMASSLPPLQLSEPFVTHWRPDTDLEPGLYDIFVSHSSGGAHCGWLRAESESCQVGQVEIVGAPLPEGATNFDDKIALLSVEIPERELSPGGLFAVNLTWQALANIEKNYTVFVQVLDSEDRIVGQVDAWPLQGTYPTRQWGSGESVRDPYSIRLDPGLSSGPHTLHVGWYLLETLRRLPVVDDQGAALDDKVVIPGLMAP